jgi:hypothetical protein
LTFVAFAALAGACSTTNEAGQGVVLASESVEVTDVEPVSEATPDADQDLGPDGDPGSDQDGDRDQESAGADPDNEPTADPADGDSQPWCGETPPWGPPLVGDDWTEGEMVELEMSASRTDQPGLEVTTEVLIEVLADSLVAYDLRWTSRSDVIPPDTLPRLLRDRLKDQTEQYDLLVVEYRLGFNGVELTNAAAIREQMTTAVEAMTAQLLLVGVGDDESMAAMQSMLDAILNLPDEQLAFSVAEHTLLFHVFDGIPLEPGLQYETPDILPNKLGGEPFPATLTLNIADEPDADGCMTVSTAVVAEPDELARIMGESMEAVTDNPFEPEDFAGLEMRNEIVARVDPATGRVRSVVGTQTGEIPGEDANTKTISIRQVGF